MFKKFRPVLYLFIILFLTVINTSRIFADSIEINPTANNVEHIKKDYYNYETYTYSVVYSVGHEYSTFIIDNTTYYEYHDYRAAWNISLGGIPSDAYNITATLYVCVPGNNSAKMVMLPDNLYLGYSKELFDAITGNAFMEAYNDPNTPETDIMTCDMTSIVNSKRTQGYFKIGAYPGGTSWGTSTVSVKLKVSFDRPINITATNNFTASNNTNGLINVDGGSNRNAPYPFSKQIGQSATLLAVSPQTDNQGFQRVWHSGSTNTSAWIRYRTAGRVDNVSNIQQHTISYISNDDQGATYEANLRKICNVSYSTQAGGVTQSWSVTVNGSSYPSPTSNFNVVEQNSITANVTQHYDFGGNVWYWFDKWSDNVVQLERTDNPTTHKNLTALYKTVPVFHEGRYRNLVITGTVRPGVGNIKLMWSEHPNTNVTQYQVWRRIKYINGVPQSLTPVLIATVNRGTTQYIDYNFTYTPTDLSTVLEYDVKAYYAPEGTTSQDDWESVSAYDARVDKSAGEPEIAKITEYKVMNYPNPFNPTTTINYQLPEPGFVTLKVYDMLGKEVAVLVNEYKDQGSYNAEFEGNNLSSGLYFYELRSNNFVSVKKMMLLR